MAKKDVIVTIICALITGGGVYYTSYASKETAVQVASIKADTEKKIKLAEAQSVDNIIRLKAQLAAERESRVQSAEKENAFIAEHAKNCDELRSIRDVFSVDLPEIRLNNVKFDAAEQRLQTAYNKLPPLLNSKDALSFYYISVVGEKSSDELRRIYIKYNTALLASNVELKVSCLK